MWLLSAARAELKSFKDPEDVPRPGICILSHTWGKPEDELTFQDVQRIGRECQATGANPRDHVSDKLRKCCEVAEKDGYEWVWIDTCCIDKTSGAELAEAINSMYRYYSLSSICYVYLADVVADRGVDDVSLIGRFRMSRWHRRGWTLQELIAPKRVVFFSREWVFLGTKYHLAELLEEDTGIPATLLRGKASLSSFSTAQRMYWAARRETSLKEDEAYCLLGIFNIRIPILYGEGGKAFERLQEAIIRESTDTTIFAWGLSTLSVTSSQLVPQLLFRPLLADSPRDFSKSGGVASCAHSRPQCEADYRTADDSYKSHICFAVTPHGIFARVLSADVKGITLLDLDWHTWDGPLRIYLAFNAPMGGNDMTTSWHVGGTDKVCCCVHISDNIDVTWKLQELYIPRPRNETDNTPRICFPCNSSSRAPFHFQLHRIDTSYRIDACSVGAEWTGHEPAVLNITSDHQQFHLTFGVCTQHDRGYTEKSGIPLKHWIRACVGLFKGCPLCAENHHHCCQNDHVLEEESCADYWVEVKEKLPGLSSHDVLVQHGIRVKLSFTRHPWVPSTLVLEDIEISPLKPELRVSVHRPLTKTLDQATCCILLHTDTPFVSTIAGAPIYANEESIYLGSAMLDSGRTLRPCKIAVKNGVAKAFLLECFEEVEYHGYYYLLAFDNRRMHWVSKSRRIQRPVLGGWRSDSEARVFHARSHKIRSQNTRYLGYVQERIPFALVECNGEGKWVEKFQVLCWKENNSEGSTSTSQHISSFARRIKGLRLWLSSSHKCDTVSKIC